MYLNSFISFKISPIEISIYFYLRFFHFLKKVPIQRKFCNILVHASLRCVYQVTKTVQAVLGSIVVVDTLTRCAVLHSVCDLKVAEMNMQWSLIRELKLLEFEVGHNTWEATKNIHSAVTQELKGKRLINRK